VVISEVYGGGGNSGATFTHDFIELYNRGADPVNLSGWSVQYASASGTTYQLTELSGAIGAGEHYLVQQNAGSGGTSPLPAPDATGSISMSASSGKVALALGASALTCGTSCAAVAGVRDFVGYGSANDFEGDATAPGLSNTTAATRNPVRLDTDQNGVDFTAAEPAPQNGGDGGEPEPPSPAVAIQEIQGTEHRSPFEGEAVSNVPGVVSQRSINGFWMQDPTDDGDASTSEGIFVFTRSAPAAALTRGTAVTVSGTVSEFRPGGDSTANLSITQIAASSVETGPEDRVPAATVLGPDGRTPPNRIIEDDSSGDAELDNTFDPAVDGIDFWESMEGMRVRVQAPEVVGPTSRFDELPVVTAGATVRTVRDGIVLRGDEDPRRRQPTSRPTATPSASSWMLCPARRCLSPTSATHSQPTPLGFSTTRSATTSSTLTSRRGSSAVG